MDGSWEIKSERETQTQKGQKGTLILRFELKKIPLEQFP